MMHDFGEFCYLDVQKTGSTFISKFLNKHSMLTQVGFKKHGRLEKPEQIKPGKFFFISAREPLDQYKSLYSYGMHNRGSLFAHLAEKENDKKRRKFYDGTAEGFCDWLRFVMDPKNVPFYKARQPEDVHLFGPMTLRFLKLSFFHPGRVLKQITDFDSLLDIYQKNKVHTAVVKNESLNEDMAGLVNGPLHRFIKDPEAAVAELRSNEEKTNASVRSDKQVGYSIDPELLLQLRERERFLFEVIGYGEPNA